MLLALREGTATFRRDSALKLGFIFLCYIDLALTLLALRLGFSELNPLMRQLLDRPLELFMVKGAAPLFIGWLVPGKLILPAIAAMVLVAGWNIKELLLPLV